MRASLLVRESAPPRPSVCRMSGLPKTARIIRSRNSRSCGRSSSFRKIPLLVPPRMIVHSNLVFRRMGYLLNSSLLWLVNPLTPVPPFYLIEPDDKLEQISTVRRLKQFNRLMLLAVHDLFDEQNGGSRRH